MSMAMMVAMASRKRDDKGRYMDGGDDRRMDGDYSPRADGGYARMGDAPEMRKRRDSDGRYMTAETRMMDDRPQAHYWPEPHIPPYLEDTGMRGREAQNPHALHDGGRMDGRPSMRDSNIVNIRDYQDKRLIGFRSGGFRTDDDDEETEMRQYGRKYDPSRMTAGHAEKQYHHMGRADGSGSGDHLTRDEAERWVARMKSADGKTGGRWPYQEVKRYAGNFDVHGEEKIVEFYAVMNALATDYGDVAKRYGVDKVDFWADLAKAFIDDKDAVPGKVKKYYECIAQRDEE